MINIIQWNLNGFFKKQEELKLIIQNHDPQIICLQETNFKDNFTAHLKNYDKNRRTPDRASGGVTNFIKSNIPNKEIKINKLENIIRQLPKPFIIVGDFNSHNIIWGSNNTNPRGKTIEKLIQNEDLILLNDTTPTHINLGNGNFSCIDLSLSSPSIAQRLEWEVLPEIYSSDHIPIKVKISPRQTNNKYSNKQRWNLKNPNWNLYTDLLEEETKKILLLNIINIEKITQIFTDLITDIATKTIGTTNQSKKSRVPWWNNKIKEAVSNKNKALKNYKKNKTPENFIELKRLRAKSKFLIKNSKNESWNIFTSTINGKTNPSEVWKKIKSLKGLSRNNDIFIKANYSTITDQTDVADALGNFFHENFSDKLYEKKFINDIKTPNENIQIKSSIDPNSQDQINLNLQISIGELEQTLTKCKSKSPGPDKIPYSFLQNSGPATKQHLLNIFNHIWKNGQIPTGWKTDDFNFWCKSPNLKTVQHFLQDTTNNITVWSTQTGFKISSQKSQCIIFTNKKGQNHINVQLNDIPIPNKNTIKILGVYFDNKINWMQHLKHLKISLTRNLNIMKMLSHTTWEGDEHTLLKIHRQLIREKLDYGATIYQSAKPHHIKIIDTSINASLRLAIGAYRSSPILTPPIIYKNHLNEILQEHKHVNCYYTDTSRSEKGVGIAITNEDLTIRFKLPENCSIYTAEAIAILKTVEYVSLNHDHDNLRKNNLILSDSLSTLISLKNTFNTTDIAKLILQKISQASKTGIKIALIWIPGHSDIEGNEKADQEAKKAAECTDTPTLNITTFADTKNQIKELFKIKWQTHWLEQNSKLRKIKNSILSWPNSLTKRREKVVINRLRIGHTRLTHGYLMAKDEKPMCTTCGTELTVNHILTECRQYTEELDQLNIPTTLDAALGPDTDTILQILTFLRKTDLYNLI
ncbi:hypothetical protein AGLY_012198 [Aphis glycines]|uniref:RNase H type-1 domain-containing protein n=1 Tax=Aphis glycines TaxID=307491 RepID=A0A6G0T9E8_APHGL|nr:hypothetical protein AGLY_012198 [Aphis glycines]